MSHTMRVIEITKPGGPEVLKLATRAVPVANAGDIVIRVAYAGVNRPDALQRAGAYAPPPSASPRVGHSAYQFLLLVGIDEQASLLILLSPGIFYKSL